MNWIDARILFSLYLKFINRKILNIGILKEKRNKWIILLIIIFLWSTMLFLSYSFFDSMIQLEKNFLLILKFYALSTLVYSMVAFSFFKILFIKSYDLLTMTTQLPVSNKVRRMSLLIFEFSSVLLIVLLFISPLIIGFILKTNSRFIGEIVTNTVFVAVIAYVSLNFLYQLFFFLLEKTGLEINQYFISIIYLSCLLFLGLQSYKSWGDSVIASYYGTKSLLIPPLLFSYLFEKFSFIVALLTFLVLFMIFTSLSMYLSSNKIIDNKKYFSVNLKCTLNFKFNMAIAYICRPFRLKENYLLLILCISGYLLGKYHEVKNIHTIFLLLSFNSIYSIVQTDKLRNLTKSQMKYQAHKEYLLLVISNLFFTLASSVPFVLIESMLKKDISLLLVFLGMTIFSIVYLMMVGILFPPTYDNPISIAFGMMVTTMISLLMLVIFMLLDLPIQIEIISSVVIFCSIIGLSINILAKYERM